MKVIISNQKYIDIYVYLTDLICILGMMRLVVLRT